MSNFFNLPNILTLSRMLLLPFFVIGFYLESRFGLICSLVIFLICCVTDYLDGYLARTYKQTTEIGKMLDPLADKILVSISILFIAGFGMISKITFIPAAIILCREIIISGVRDAVVSSGNNFKTSILSKWKTSSQMVSIAIIFLSFIMGSNVLSRIGEAMFWGSSAIAIISGFVYCKRHILLS